MGTELGKRMMRTGAEFFRDLKVEHTILERRFDELDTPARAIFEALLRRGVVKEIAGGFDYSRQMTGAPEIREGADGFLYPVRAVMRVEIDGQPYTVEFTRSGWTARDFLTLRIHCHPQNLQIADEFLHLSPGERILITKSYRRLETLKRLFEYLSHTASTVQLKPGRYDQLPRMTIDPSLGLLPLDMALEVNISGHMYKFALATRPGEYGVEVECSTADIHYVETLLERIIHEEAGEGRDQVYTLFSPIEVKQYTWEHVGGLSGTREALRELIEYPLRNPSLFRHMGVKPPKGILFSGPPGTGKTTVAKILANETRSLFYTVSPKDINSMWYGESERNIGRLFTMAREDVKRGQTVIIFIDEIDGFYASRTEMHEVTRRAFSQLCSEMDGISDLEGVVIIGATNRYQDLDPALVRPGRFDRKIQLGMPDTNGREEIFRVHLRGTPVSPDVDVSVLALRSGGLSGAEIANVCQKAGYLTIRRYAADKHITILDIVGRLIDEVRVTQGDLLQALDEVVGEGA